MILISVITLSILLVLRPANLLGAVDHNFENSLPADLQNSVCKLLLLLSSHLMCSNTLTNIRSNYKFGGVYCRIYI